MKSTFNNTNADSSDTEQVSSNLTEKKKEKRNFEPEPRIDATRLIRRKGPVMSVCIHIDKGFLLGIYKRQAIWSHDSTGDSRQIINLHPDDHRVVACFINDEEAKNYLMRILHAIEWKKIAMTSVRADVILSNDENNRLSEGPIPLCSVEACSAATNEFKPLSCHLLEPIPLLYKVINDTPYLGGAIRSSAHNPS